jgi:N-acetylglucosamine kinase-like BadF-type ATPase
MSTESRKERLIIGVDGGGTKTEAVLAAVGPGGSAKVLGKGRGGPSNMRLAGKRQALESLDTAVRTATADVLKDGVQADIAVLALAGSDFSDVKAEIRRWASECGLCRRVEIISDADPVMAAGTPDRWGVALVVGTGSVAIGVDRKGRSITRGGWGHWYGDHGSGYDLGARALSAVSEAEDGMGPETVLTARMLDHFGLENPRLIIQALYAGGNVRAQIAAASPVVMEAAAAGDIVAVRIVEQCAAELVRLVTAVTCDLEFEAPYPLALAGGAICRNPSYRARLEKGLHAVNPAPGPITLVPEPVMGCFRIGYELLEN